MDVVPLTTYLKIMLDIKEIANFYRLGFLIRYLTRSEIIDWADSIIKASESPNIYIIEISLGNDLDVNELCNHLLELSGHSKNEISAKVLISKIISDLKKNKLSIKKATQLINSLFNIIDISEDERNWMICFDDDLEAVRDGLFSDLKMLKNDMVKHFTKYDKYELLV